MPTAQGAAQAGEETRGSATVSMYTDDDRVTVWSPMLSGATVVGQTEFEANATVDVVSAASVDVVSSASPGTVNEQRVQLGATLRHPLSRLVEGRTLAIASTEEDYDALRVGIGSSGELADRNFTLDMQVVAAFDQVTSAIDKAFSESRQGVQVDLSLTQILDADTYVDVILEGRSMVGYHASPYRSVVVRVPESTALTMIAEATPEMRLASATLLRVRRALLDELFVHTSYSYYVDDWEIDSHTGKLLVVWQPVSAIRFGANARGYVQSRASFYRPRYQAPAGDAPRHRTRDKMLGAMNSWQLGLNADYALFTDTRVSVATSVMRFNYRDFPAQAHRMALRSSVGLEHTF